MRESDIIAPLGLMSIMGMLAGDKKSNLLQAQIDAYQKEQEEAKNKEEVADENVIPGELSESEALSINTDALKEDPDYVDLADVPEYLKVQPVVGTGDGLLEGLPVDERGDYAGNDPTITRSGAKKFLTSENLIGTLFGFPQTMIADAFKLAAAPMTQGEIEDFYTGNESTGVQDLLYSGHGFAKHKDTYDLQAGDTNIYGNKVLMDSPLYDAGSPYHDLFKADGGLVPPLRGPMSSGIGTLYKLK